MLHWDQLNTQPKNHNISRATLKGRNAETGLNFSSKKKTCVVTWIIEEMPIVVRYIYLTTHY
jgi:hypothetical protein